jgi:hypothetical protein
LDDLAALQLSGNDLEGSVPEGVRPLGIEQLQVDDNVQCSCCSENNNRVAHTGYKYMLKENLKRKWTTAKQKTLSRYKGILRVGFPCCFLLIIGGRNPTHAFELCQAIYVASFAGMPPHIPN